MRILFTFVGGRGHFEPMLPVARAAQSAGHTVAFGCAPPMAKPIAAAGFEALAMGVDSSRPVEPIALRPLDPAREDRDLRERFARRAAAVRVPLTIERCRDWRPDVLVCDETDFGAMIAAESLELPFATVLVIATGAFVRREVVAEPLDELRAEHGLARDPSLQMLARDLVLSPFPASFRDPAHPLPAAAYAFRSTTPAAPQLPPPSWASTRPGAPTVYFTLGTIFHLESGDLLERVIAGLRELPVNLLVTTGDEIDPERFGPQPDHVHLRRFVAQACVLPHCDLVVSHGGSGSVLGALAHGLPSLLIPLGADQPLNARRCEQLGVATRLEAMSVTPAEVRRAAAVVLERTRYREAARRMRDEIAALPDPAHAVDRLEQLSTQRRPLYSS